MDLDGADQVDLCVDVRFGTFERELSARMTARLQLVGASREAVIDSARLGDNAVHRTCWALGDPTAVTALLAASPIISFRVADDEVGPAVLLAADGSPDVRMLLRWEEPLGPSAGLVRVLPQATSAFLTAIVLGRSRQKNRSGG